MKIFFHTFKRFLFATKGIGYALKHDTSFKIQFYVGGIFLLIFWYLLRPFSELESLFLILSWVLVLKTELQNSSFETALDKLHPSTQKDIGVSKDMAAGSVLITALFALFVVIWILIRHLA